MSVIWFLILSYAFQQGVEITEIPFLMISIFYVGDCILMTKNKCNNDLGD